MATSSYLVGSVEGFANQTIDVWTIPVDDMVFWSSPVITDSYPGSGTTVTNIAPAGSSETGTITGNTTHDGTHFDFEATTGAVTWTAFSGIENVFDGTGTVLVWFYADTAGEGGFGRIVDKTNDLNGWNIYITRATDPDVVFACRSTGATYEYDIDYSEDVINYGGWHLLAVEFDADNPGTPPNMWVDGVAATVTVRTAGSGTRKSDAGSPLYQGNRPADSNTFDGKQGDIYIYTRSLSNAEHLAIFNATKGDYDGTIDNESTLTFSYDGTYLEHSTAGLSMMGTLEAALVTAGVAGCTASITDAGYVKLAASEHFGITWGTATALRDQLGFSGDLAPDDEHVATNRSPLLWVPRRNESPSRAPLGIAGENLHAVSQVTSRDGTQVTRQFGDAVRRNEYTWHYIDKAQYWENEAAGELWDWLEEVGIPGEKFFLYRAVDSGDYTGTDSVTLGTGLGPYELTNGLRSLRLIRAAGFERTDCKFDWTAEVIKTPEYGT